jgi:membrane protease YdiL (CAAX protease family)
MIGVCALSNVLHRDGRRALGLDPAMFKPCALATLKAVAAPLLLLFSFALLRPAPPLPKVLFGVLGYPLWAFAPQYALQSFVANRLRDALGERPWTIALVGAGLFSFVHLPNPYLMTAGFVGGLVFTRVFLKTPHLVPLALAHAAAGFFISVILQQDRFMMIGRAYLRHAGH